MPILAIGFVLAALLPPLLEMHVQDEEAVLMIAAERVALSLERRKVPLELAVLSEGVWRPGANYRMGGHGWGEPRPAALSARLAARIGGRSLPMSALANCGETQSRCFPVVPAVVGIGEVELLGDSARVRVHLFHRNFESSATQLSPLAGMDYDVIARRVEGAWVYHDRNNVYIWEGGPY